ncbi:type II toxin-antitoxin system VapC family toxin [Pyrolobus fumarii]|uniref:type II toxin-antitoxin system VapC family toxin n=1 Tax=Pyrolobus fumarii TaxID=54252 RepID=UPI001FCB5E03|nr:type II toxin-antitoxin system VapC family toxin [Pyrolobus fumarii]
MPRRFIDSNVFVYVLSGDSRFAQRALAILEDAEDGVYEAYTSTLVVSQVLAHLERRGRREAMEKFLEYLGDSPITVVETRLDDFTYALRLARENNLSFQKLWDDLVIASQMVRLGIREIYSNDTDFDRIPGITRLF